MIASPAARRFQPDARFSTERLPAPACVAQGLRRRRAFDLIPVAIDSETAGGAHAQA
jgi:hypothetical protein